MIVFRIIKIDYFIQSERQQADLRALLAKAKSIRDALVVIEGSVIIGPLGIGGRSARMYQFFEFIYSDQNFHFRSNDFKRNNKQKGTINYESCSRIK
jgi:hypothetical protein